MIRSLYLYGNHLAKLTLRGNLAYVVRDLSRYGAGGKVFRTISPAGPAEREQALHQVIHWLLLAQKKMNDSGFGSWHIARGWGTSYPETTGYIIPTLLHYSLKFRDERSYTAAVCAGDFLLSIQMPSGGWQGGRIGEKRPEIVFNTGQVIRGMMALHEYTKEEKYLSAAGRAGDWLCRVQHPDGYWKEHALMNEHRVYDAFVDAPLLALFKITGEERYREAALKNLNWIVDKKMKPDGWFSDCDNTIGRNDRPILHTIAYTLDGLLESDELLHSGIYRDAARIGADAIRDSFLLHRRFYGRYDHRWQGSEYMLCTGAAQMAVAWMRLFRLTGELSYLEAADLALATLLFIQDRGRHEKADSKGAIPGSFPIYGRYEPFAFPNWASKFFADALMMREEFNT